MENKRFERVFLLFAREDQDIYGGQSPSGFVKIDTVENKVKISSSIQGLNPYANEELCLYIFGRNNSETNFYNAGSLESRQHKCELMKEIILENRKDYEALRNIEGAVVAGIRKTEDVTKIYCPLIAYKNNLKIEYRDVLTKLLLTPVVKAPPLGLVKNIEDCEYEEQEPEQDISREELQFDNIVDEDIPHQDIAYEYESPEAIPEKDSTAIESEQIAENDEKKDSREYEQYQNMLRQLGFLRDKTECSEICMEPSTDLQREVCENCSMTGNEGIEINKQPLNSTKLRIIFNKYFEPYDPFKIRRQDYRWWKVGSPVQLNNILYQNNIKTPLLFNPQLMMAHFKYRHILIGIYSNRRQRKEYVVCGVPSIYNVDDKPFGEYCRWAQLESSKPRHGAFGYWLVYIDLKTGNFLAM